MSNGYAEFISDGDYDKEQARDMGISAFMGDGLAIQITLGANWNNQGIHTYFCLSEFQVRELIKCLQSRLEGRVTSTGVENMGIYFPHHKTNDEFNLVENIKSRDKI